MLIGVAIAATGLLIVGLLLTPPAAIGPLQAEFGGITNRWEATGGSADGATGKVARFRLKNPTGSDVVFTVDSVEILESGFWVARPIPSHAEVALAPAREGFLHVIPPQSNVVWRLRIHASEDPRGAKEVGNSISSILTGKEWFPGPEHYFWSDALRGGIRVETEVGENGAVRASAESNAAIHALAEHSDNLMVDQRTMPEPDGPANGSQPIRSETNRTSSAAGSRR
jgi:hypothetical protein